MGRASAAFAKSLRAARHAGALVALCVALAAATLPAVAATTVKDDAALKPPTGARIAIIEFDDLQCPACAMVNPLLVSAVSQYKIPLVRHDLLIPSHNWSRIAAINARWFDAQGKGLGDGYRNEVFANQSSIFNPLMLRQFTYQFAQSHGVTLPADMDPSGKLANEVEADRQLSLRTGVALTPTIFIVTAGPDGNHYEEVTDHTKLFPLIDAALAKLKSDAPAAGHKAKK